MATKFICTPEAVCRAIANSDCFMDLPTFHRAKINLAAGYGLTNEEKKCAEELGYVAPPRAKKAK
jgi:hypothetical protein